MSIVTVAKTLPAGLAHDRSVASMVSARKPLSASALPKLSSAATSSAVAYCTRPSFCSAGIEVSASRNSTPVSASGAGSGAATGAGTTARGCRRRGSAAGRRVAELHPETLNAATTVTALRNAVGGARGAELSPIAEGEAATAR